MILIEMIVTKLLTGFPKLSNALTEMDRVKAQVLGNFLDATGIPRIWIVTS